MLRDTLKNKIYFDEAIRDTDESISEYLQRLKEPEKISPTGRMGGYAGLYRLTLNRLEYCYSRGDKIENSKKDISNLLKYREMQQSYANDLPGQDSDRRVEWEKLTLDQLQNTLWWLAFAVCLDFDESYFLKALDLIDNKGIDALLDKIAVTLGDASRPQSNKLLYPKYFKGIFEVIESSADERPFLLKKYLDSWYVNSKVRGWHDLHLITNNFGYSGYWCFEAALIVKLYNIDDSSFRDHQYYPAALVHGD